MAHWLTYLPTDKVQPGTSVTQDKGLSKYSEKAFEELEALSTKIPG